MNKKLFILPLLTSTLLLGCGRNDPTGNKYKVTINTVGSKLTPSIDTYEFVENHFDTFEITYEGDDLYGLSKSAVTCSDERAAAIDVDEVNRVVKVTPQRNTDFEITVTPFTIQYNVTFHAEGLTIRGHEGEDEVTIQCNRKSRFGSYKLAVENYKYNFNGWSYSKSLVGDTINDNDVLLQDIDVYPSYELGVSVIVDTKDESLKDLYSIEQTVIFTNDVRFYINIKDENHYSLYNEDQTYPNISITSNGQTISGTIDNKTNSITIPNESIDGNIKITIEPYRPSYKVIKDVGDHLNLFLTSDTIYKGDDCGFLLQAYGSATGTDYYHVPSLLEIKINNNILPSDAYHIDILDDNNTFGYCTIYAKYITGDISIYATPSLDNNYMYQIRNFGTVEYEPSENEGEMKTNGIKGVGNDFSFIIKNTEGLSNPIGPENVVVDIDNTNQWVTAKEESEKGEDARFTFETIDEETGDIKFSIKANVVQSSIYIYMRHPDYDILNDLSWLDIETISDKGLASKIFYIGDEKDVFNYKRPKGSKSYKARIIDFDHDNIANSNKKAGITFEFTDLISNNKNDGIIKKQFIDINYDIHFKNLVYHKYLNNNFLNDLDKELVDVIKYVNKTVYQIPYKGERESYNTRLFPISACEIFKNFAASHNQNDGYLYKYYEIHNSKKDKVKCALDGTKRTYWTRTANIFSDYHKGEHAYTVENTGSVGNKHSNKNAHGYTALFCI